MKYSRVIAAVLALFAGGCSVSALPERVSLIEETPAAPSKPAGNIEPAASAAVVTPSIVTGAPPPAESGAVAVPQPLPPAVTESPLPENLSVVPVVSPPAEVPVREEEVSAPGASAAPAETCAVPALLDSESEARLEAVDKAVSEVEQAAGKEEIYEEQGAGSVTEEDIPGGVADAEEDIEEEAAPGQVVDDIEAIPPGVAWVIPDREPVRAVLREFTGVHHKTMQRMLNRSGRHLPFIMKTLREEGLPGELAIIAMVESGFNQTAKSPAGAGGLWQFIPSTGKLYGLRVDWWVDQRMDPELATKAAARHLKDLYAKFGDWELAAAAYNAGSGTITRALDRCRQKDFWGLASSGRIRKETSRYVPKIYAFLLIASDPSHYGFVKEPEPEFQFETVPVDGAVDFATIARKSGVEKSVIEQLNPALLRGCTPPRASGYPLRVPSGSGASVSEAIASLEESEKLSLDIYTARQGDTIEKIAKKYGVPVQAILDLNRMPKAKKLKKGTKLAVSLAPGSAPPAVSVSASDGGPLTHKVRAGDTVWKVARNYGVTAKEVIAWNSLGKRAAIKPGDVLVVSREGYGDTVASGTGQKYTVTSGDTISSIARSKGVSIKNLLLWNSLEHDSVIRPGDTLRLGPEAN